ncbi:MAG TPA: hypothetical protein PKX28_06655, partial [Candidatus Hydrogenedentes bacterium]|nr:hypothetical protein [Candidatus Hydrogenedentota bacterium]
MSKHGKRGIGYGGVAALLAVLTLCMFSAVGQDAAAPPPPAQEASDAGAVAASPPADATGAL